MSNDRTAAAAAIGREEVDESAAPAFVRWPLGFAPAAVTLFAMFPVLPAPIRAVIFIGGFLFAPGFLLWWSLGGPISRKIGALPALAFAFSFAAILPATIAFLFFEVTPWGIARPLVALLVLLGWRASTSPFPKVERPLRIWWLLPVLVVGVAAAFRVTDFDQLTHISIINVIKLNGHYPDMNPFLIGDVPLAPRWRINGWTGWLGILSHLSGIGAIPLVTKLLPPLFVVVAASATFLFASYLADDRFGAIAAVLAATVFPILWVVPEPIAQTRLWLSAASEDKSVAFLVLLPVAMVALLQLFRHAAWRRGAGATALLLALFFVHPLMFVFAVLLAGTYLAVDTIASRRLPLRAGMWLAAAVLPAAVVGLAVTQTTPAFGVSLDGVEVADVAVRQKIGPVAVWEPFLVAGEEPPNAPDGRTFFALRRLGFTGGGVARYMIVGGTVMPSFRLLFIGVHVAILLACLFVSIRAPSGPLRRWIIAATFLAVLPFLVPPAAAVLGKIATPWVLWRFIWLLPLPLAAAWLLDRASRRSLPEAIAFVALIGVIATTFSPEPWTTSIFERRPLSRSLADGSGNLMVAPQFATWTTLQGGEFRSIFGRAIRGPNNFPRDRLEEARRRDLDVRDFYTDFISLEQKMNILERYEVTHILAKKWQVRRLERQGIEVIDPEALPLNFVLFRAPVSEGT